MLIYGMSLSLSVSCPFTGSISKAQENFVINTWSVTIFQVTFQTLIQPVKFT